MEYIKSKLSEDLAKIHRALKGAICIAAIQKHPNSNQPLGGMHSMQKPTLAIALDYNKTIRKAIPYYK